jgi:hypothetical protein
MEPGETLQSGGKIMARYTLKSFLRQTQNSLLQEFFKQKELLQDFEWYRSDSSGSKMPLPETDINSLADAIEQQLDNNDLLAVEKEFKQICWMATDDRIFCLIDLGTKPKFRIDLVKEFRENCIEGYYSRSMYVYLHHKDLFDYALKFMEIINMESARTFEIGPGRNPKIDDPSLTVLKNAVIKHYVRKGRGDKCVIDCYHKKGQTDEYCYYIFQEDCVKNVLDFDESGEHLVWQPRRNNFDNVFFFEPKTGDLRIHAGGERNTEQLADLFCKHILDLPGRPNYDTQVYDLSRVKDPEFAFDPQTPIEKIHLKEIVCDMGSNEEVIFKVKGKEEKELLLKDRMLAAIKAYGIDPGEVTVLKIRFQVLFKKKQGVKGRNSRTKEITLPNKTDVTGDDFYDTVIRKHIEQIWKLRRHQLPAKGAEEAA